ncbi:MAG: hypothetical protein LBB05_03360 [Puniceicoccales bacterium]|jgi:hypothetical protein|nr:hypothetical protein [Puniceicoccales bacterium]
MGNNAKLMALLTMPLVVSNGHVPSLASSSGPEPKITLLARFSAAASPPQAAIAKPPPQAAEESIAGIPMGKQKWESSKLTLDDLSDLRRELLLIATGKAWPCIRPLVDFQMGITCGKTVEEIEDMLEKKFPQEVCARSPLASDNRKYCQGRINILISILISETLEKAFIEHHARDIVNYDCKQQQFLINRIAFHLCPPFDMDLTEYLLQADPSDVVNSVFDRELSGLDGLPLALRRELDCSPLPLRREVTDPDYPSNVLFNFDGDLLFSVFLPVALQLRRVSRRYCEIQVRRRRLFGTKEERDFRIAISHPIILQSAVSDIWEMEVAESFPVFRDSKRGAGNSLPPPNSTPFYFHVRMAGHEFPIDEANSSETRIKMVYLSNH